MSHNRAVVELTREAKTGPAGAPLNVRVWEKSVHELAATTLELQSAAPARSAAKVAFDTLVAAAALVFLAPLLILCAIAIKLDSAGPVIFRQRRTGLNGRVFHINKFRTMRVAEDGENIRQASRDDARVTRVGAFLRRTSIDELPQLLNVLRGDMSLIGPRPHALAHDARFGAQIATYRGRFRAKPGLTGLAQVRGHRGEIQDIAEMVDRVDSDNAYIENWSLWLDLRIAVATLGLLFGRDPNAY